MARWAHGLGVVAGLGVAAFVVASACLPDLPPNLCGNGHIDESANEECDPGANDTDPGCASNCSISCETSPGDPRTYYFDPGSHHCYFAPPGKQTNSGAVQACLHDQKAHLITLVDDNELQGVLQDGNFLSTWPEEPRFWVGFSGSDVAGPYVASAPREPGWAVTSTCAGCFLHGLGETPPPIVDGGPEAGRPADIVATQLSTTGDAVMAAIGPNATANTLCEREPVGSRSLACFGGSYCFTVLATADLPSPKAYLYNPSAVTSAQAEAFCHALTDAGRPSLVVFETRSEREQVVYELTQLALLNEGPAAPSQFWIGLSTGAADAGSGWVWDDGVAASPTSTGSHPAVWGNFAGRSRGAGHAYIYLQGTYDDGLAYAGADSDHAVRPFVCQYQ